MRFLRRTLVGLFLMSVALGLVAYAGQMVREAVEARLAQASRSMPARERVFAVNVVAYEPGNFTPVLATFGEVISRRTLDIRAGASGEVVMLAPGFQEGGRVAAGEVLVRVDPADAEAAVEIARTDLAEAEAELREAGAALELARADLAAAEEQEALRRQALDRQRSLSERGVGTEAAVETAALAEAAAKQAVLSRRQALASATARLDLAGTGLDRRRIALAEAERRLAETRVVARFAGSITEVAVVEGGLVQANERLARLVDPDALEVSFRVSTAEYARLLDNTGALIGAEVTATLDASGVDLTARGRISRESAVVGDGQTGRQLFAQIEGAAGFRPGDFVTLEIEEPELRGVARLPSAALDAAATVLVLGEGDRLEVVQVDLLRRQGDDVLVRAPGLAGRQVVAERSALLGAGIKVRAVRPDAPGATPAPAPEAPAMVELTEERRARLVAFVEANTRMPDEAKKRVLAQLQAGPVPAEVVARLEARMGG